ncbi:hypothetical protein [Kordia sp.]|uniref:hypothetical protein n=1 Tax=Kordia sp. TaxID=1965332 RepID=UPI0025C18BDA|nr:hypothetical protein [Kordia sp.]MCH2196516.1 hypothetical protein [Kordia sp.]
MKKYLLCFLICASLSVYGFSQNDSQASLQPAQDVYFMKGSDGFHYINDQYFYTMKFLGENVEYMDNGAFKIQDHLITLIETDYDTSIYNNTKGIEEEKRVLQAYKDVELKYFEEFSEQKMTVKEEFFSNKDGKLFYLFSMDIPLDKVNTDEDYLKRMNILCFIVNDKMATISFPLFKSENEAEKTAYIKALTESVAIFPANIDIDFLRRRVLNKDNEDLVVDVVEANVSFVVPDYLNVVNSNDPMLWSASFPDVNNVKNAVVIRMTEKTEFDSLEAFNKEILPQGKMGEDDGRMTLLLKEELQNIGEINGKSMRLQYMPKGTMRLYHAKKMTFETKTHYGLVMFNATPDTYEGNVKRFDEFLKTFKIQTK